MGVQEVSVASPWEEVFFKKICSKISLFKFKVGFHSPRNFQPDVLIEKIQLIVI